MRTSVIVAGASIEEKRPEAIGVPKDVVLRDRRFGVAVGVDGASIEEKMPETIGVPTGVVLRASRFGVAIGVDAGAVFRDRRRGVPKIDATSGGRIEAC